MGRYWLVLGGTWSVWGVTGWYLVVLGQYMGVLVGTWWYWVSIGQYGLIYDVYWVSMKRNCLIHHNTGSVEGSSGQYLVVLGQYDS